MKPVLFSFNLSQIKAFTLSAIVVLCCSCNEMYDIADLNSEQTEITNEFSNELENSVVTSQDAADVASTFWASINNVTRANVENLEYEQETINAENKPQVYVFNFNKGGFVLVSATKDYFPILAYSKDGTFTIGEEPIGLKMWLEETKYAQSHFDQQADSVKAAIRLMWDQYNTDKKTFMTKGTRATSVDAGHACTQRLEYYYKLTSGSGGWYFAPLSQAENIFAQYGLSAEYESLCYRAQINNSDPSYTVIGWRVENVGGTYGPFLNTSWHQHTPFSDNIGHAAGCGTIAVAQLMNYYHYPNTFVLGNVTYNWDNIPNYISATSDQAALVKYVYGKIDTEHVLSWIFTRPNNLKDGLRDMGYNVTRQNHNYLSVINELKNSRPVIMLGNEDNPPNIEDIEYLGKSHYWVCDGVRDYTNYLVYFTEWQPYGNGTFEPGWYSFESPDRLASNYTSRSYHMNWGWYEGGSNQYNGWFLGDTANSGNGDFRHNRDDFLISVEDNNIH